MKNVNLLLFLLLVSVGLFGQYIYNYDSTEPEIIDGRAEALGSTSILSSTGANYVFNNPAMLSGLKSIDLQLNMRTQFGKTKTSSAMSDTIYYDTIHAYTNYTRTPHFKINGLALGIPYKISEHSNWKMGFAAGYRTYYDWGYNLHQKEKDFDSPTIEEKENEYSGGFNTLVLGSGISFKNKIWGGFSISLPFLSEYSELIENNQGNQIEVNSTVKGTFFTLSGAYLLHSCLKLGARYRTKYNLVKEDNIYDEHYKYEYTIPEEYGFALEIIPYKNLKIFTEYLSCKFSDYKNVYFNGSDTKNSYSLRTGIEFGSSNLFRCGFFRQSVPIYKLIPDYNEDTNTHFPTIDKNPQIETGFTVGFGRLIRDRIKLNLFGVYSSINYKESYAMYSSGFINYVDCKNDYSYYLYKIGCTLGYSF